MRPFTVQAFRDLIAHRAAPAITIYQPTYRGFPDSRQNAVRYRDLVKRATEMLRPYCNGREGPSRWTAILERLLAHEFWEHPMDGLAVFVGPGMEVFYRLPRKVPEDVFVGETFHTKPLLEFLRINRRFYVLALSQKHVALFAGDPFGLRPVGLHGVPRSLEEAVGALVERDQLTFHGGAGGRGTPIYSGQGVGEEVVKRELEKFFRAVDRGLRPLLEDERAPVMLAAVGYYHPIFRVISRLPNLAEASLVGSFDTFSPEQLHAAAWPAIVPELNAIEDQVLAQHEKLAGAGRVTNDLAAIGPAAVAGRVRHLLLEEGAHAPGRFDHKNGAVTLDAKAPGAVDVLDEIAEQTLLRGGETIVLPAARMPARPASAALRW